MKMMVYLLKVWQAPLCWTMSAREALDRAKHLNIGNFAQVTRCEYLDVLKMDLIHIHDIPTSVWTTLHKIYINQQKED